MFGDQRNRTAPRVPYCNGDLSRTGCPSPWPAIPDTDRLSAMDQIPRLGLVPSTSPSRADSSPDRRDNARTP
jgi:hypothetical protein